MAIPTQANTEDKGLLSADMIAKVLMLNVSRIHQMGREGIIPREPGGKYRLVTAVQGYIRFLKKGTDDDELISLSVEKAKLTKAQRERAEHELAVIRNKYLPAAEVEAEYSMLAKTVIGILETLPDSLERDADLQPQQTAMVEAVVNHLRQELFLKLTAIESDDTA